MRAEDETTASAYERPSKSALKREAHEQQGLGEALTTMSEAALAATPVRTKASAGRCSTSAS
jgi:ribosomal 50S subunit-associated protein YjgA (DUF615 family)